MKLIQNSIDAENLQTSILQRDLESGMASCDIAPVNGHQSKEENSSQKSSVEKVTKITKLSNGIHENNEIPSVSNGNINGYYDDVSDDDYQLMLESSSEDGGSPSKKIDEETISAPQIVQEIEDLLGINSRSVLDKGLVDSESFNINEKDEDNLVDGESNIPQEIQDVFEEQGEEALKKIKNSGSHKDNSQIGTKVETNKNNEPTECDVSSNMNLVFDEVEIGPETVEMLDSNTVASSETLVDSSEADCKVESMTTTTENLIVSKQINESDKPDNLNKKKQDTTSSEVDLKCDDSNVTDIDSKNIQTRPIEEETDIPLTQSSSLSESSVEWAVVDSVETSDDETYLEKQEKGKCDDSNALSELNEKEKCGDVISDSKDQEDCIFPEKTTQVSVNNSKINQEGDDGNSSVFEGHGLRKRSASVGEEEMELKKAKLEREENDLLKTTLVFLKRPCLEIPEKEAKRTKLNDALISESLTTEKIDSENCRILKNNIEDDTGKNVKSPQNGDFVKNNYSEKITEAPCVAKLNAGIYTEKATNEISVEKIGVECFIEKVNENLPDEKVSEDLPAEELCGKLSVKKVNQGLSPENVSEELFYEKLSNVPLSEKINEGLTTETVNKGLTADEVNEGFTAGIESGGPSAGNISEVESDKKVTNLLSVEKINKEFCKNSETCSEDIKTVDILKKENDHRYMVFNEEIVTTHDVNKCSSSSCDESESINNVDKTSKMTTCMQKTTECSIESPKNNSEINYFTKVNELESEIKDCNQTNEVDSTSIGPVSSSDDDSEVTFIKSVFPPNEISESIKKLEKSVNKSGGIKLTKKEMENKESDVVSKETKNCSDIRDVRSSLVDTSKEKEEGLKLDSLCSYNSEETKETFSEVVQKTKLKLISSTLDTNNSLEKNNSLEDDATEESKRKQTGINIKPNQNIKISSSSAKDIEKSKKKNDQVKAEHSKSAKSPFDILSKNMQQKKTEPKRMSNLDLAIESVVDKARSDTDRAIPLLKKFHRDQLKKLTRSELEEVVVQKVCEAITDRSEIGQMRLRCQSLEQNNEVWRKKVAQFEKQNRELEMVLKRYLAETAQIKQGNQNKVPLPIKVTRSVGLQVVLASSMHGALVSSRNRSTTEPLHTESNKQPQQQQYQQQQHQQTIKSKRPEKEVPKEPAKSTPFTTPVQPVTSRGRGRPARGTSTSQSIAPQPSPPKVIPPSTPIKPVTPVKTIATPNKDLEVIDLTDKEEKAKVLPPNQNPVGAPIRVAPSTQICFVQQSAATTPNQPMAYIMQKAGGQRQQYLVATSSTSPQRPVGNVSRPPPALALPVFRTGGQIIPVQTSPQVGVRTTSNTGTTTPRQVPQGIRLVSPQPQVSAVLKHPAPLPAAPASVQKPSYKSPPPKPQLKIAKTVNGIMLSWSMTLSKDLSEMASYQLYAYQEGSQPPSTNLWKKVGDVKALPLPMACTLTQFIEGHKYHFAVRAVDVHGRIGPFSHPSTILLTK